MRNRFTAVYKLELRLICLHWSYWLLFALFSLWVMSTVTAYEPNTNAQQLLIQSLPRGVIVIISLGTLFLAAISASRPLRNRIEALEMSFPTGIEITLGRMSAVMTAAAGFLIAPLGLALVTGPFSDFITNLPAFFKQTLLIFALCTGIVWAIHTKIGITRWMYPLFALLWLGAGMSSSLNMHQFPWGLLLGFPMYAFSGSSYSSLWGMLREGDLPQSVTMFYSGLTLLLLSLVIWWTIRKRSHHSPWLGLVGGVIGLALTLAGGTRYSAGVMAAYAQEKEINQHILQQKPDFFTLPADTPYSVTRYDLTLDFNDKNAPDYTVKMEIANTGNQALDELPFSLNHQLEVTRVNIPYEREWDYVRLLPEQPLAPQATLSVEIVYHGAIWWYGGESTGRPPQADYFTRPNGVNLACSIAWYPIPGQILVGREFIYLSRMTPDCILARPAAFTVQVENAGDLHFASNLPASDSQTFASGAATWLHLMAAPELSADTVGEITVYAAQPDLELARSAAETYYTPAIAYLRQFFPDIQHVNLFVVDGGFSDYFSPLATPQNEGTLTVAVTPYEMANFPRNPYSLFLKNEQAIIESLLASGDTPLAENVAYFLWAYQQAKGDSADIKKRLGQGIDQGDAGTHYFYSQSLEERYAAAFAIGDVYAAQGADGLKMLIEQIRAHAATVGALPDQEVIAWIKDAANAH